MKWMESLVKWNDDKMVVVFRMKYGVYGCMDDGSENKECN